MKSTITRMTHRTESQAHTNEVLELAVRQRIAELKKEARAISNAYIHAVKRSKAAAEIRSGKAKYCRLYIKVVLRGLSLQLIWRTRDVAGSKRRTATFHDVPKNAPAAEGDNVWNLPTLLSKSPAYAHDAVETAERYARPIREEAAVLNAVLKAVKMKFRNSSVRINRLDQEAIHSTGGEEFDFTPFIES